MKRGRPKWEAEFGYDDAGNRRHPSFTTERRTVVATLIEIKAANLTLPEVWTRFKKQKEAITKQAVLTPKGFADVVAEFRRRKLAAEKTAKYVKDTGDFS